MKSKDLAVIILLATINSICIILIGQLEAITGIVGLGSLLTVIHALFISAVFFIFEGKRWRFFSSLRALLASSLFFEAAVFLARMPVLVIVGFIADLGFNTFYGFFHRKSKILIWGVLATLAVTNSIPLGTAMLKQL